MMIKREIEEYRRVHSGDQARLNRWLTANAVIGGAFFALMAIGAFFSLGDSNTASVQEPIHHADAK
jgi:hypothetical protein